MDIDRIAIGQREVNLRIVMHLFRIHYLIQTGMVLSRVVAWCGCHGALAGMEQRTRQTNCGAIYLPTVWLSPRYIPRPCIIPPKLTCVLMNTLVDAAMGGNVTDRDLESDRV